MFWENKFHLCCGGTTSKAKHIIFQNGLTGTGIPSSKQSLPTPLQTTRQRCENDGPTDKWHQVLAVLRSSLKSENVDTSQVYLFGC